MQKIQPFLWFDEEAEEAARFYTTIFANGRVNAINRLGDDVPGPKGKVMTISFRIADQEFMALNGGPEFKFTPAISFFVYTQTQKEIDTLWDKLCAGGSVFMELEKYPFSERFGWVQDKFGVSWQISMAGTPQRITPYLMYTGPQHGKAEQAMQYYISLFPNSGIEHIDRYGAGENEPEGTVRHARFTLNGQEFMVMDSAYEHGFTFTPATSLFVNCADQAEVDRLWEKLGAGGRPDSCGWLTDPFGVSWQIVPTVLGEMMADPDPAKARRVTQAMLKMGKLDIDQLRKAYEGR